MTHSPAPSKFSPVGPAGWKYDPARGWFDPAGFDTPETILQNVETTLDGPAVATIDVRASAETVERTVEPAVSSPADARLTMLRNGICPSHAMENSQRAGGGRGAPQPTRQKFGVGIGRSQTPPTPGA
jgi:hypothetical protein